MENDSHRYTEKDLHNVQTYETGKQIISGTRKLTREDPRPMMTPKVIIEGRGELNIGSTEWLTIAGVVEGARNELQSSGKTCIVEEIDKKYGER